MPPAAIIGGVSRFRTICFDIGQVLVRFDPQPALKRLAEAADRDPVELWEALSASNLLHHFEKGLLSTEAFHLAACQLLRKEIAFAPFCEIWADIFAPKANIPTSLLRSLGQHYRLLALSNTDPIHFPYLRSRYELFECFNDFVLSYEVGARKPEPRIYEVAIERSGGKASAMLFIDDIAEYVAAAARLGIHTLQFRSLAALLEDLRRLEVWPLPSEQVKN